MSARVQLSVETDYPWSGKISMEVVSSPESPWTLSLRIPAWARAATIDGEPVAAGEYAELTRNWSEGDRVSLEIDVAPRLTAPNPRIDAVRGCVAVERGPIVYCLEEHDLPDGVDLADVMITPAVEPVDSGPLADLGDFPTVALTGSIRNTDGWQDAEYRDAHELSADGSASETRLLAVPYFAWANRNDGGMRVWIPAAA